MNPEDDKLVTLARQARLAAYAAHGAVAEGAAVRDADGRTYRGATMDHTSAALTTSALRIALGAAISSGARGFEAAVVVSEGPLAEADVVLLREFGTGVPVLLAGPDGALRETVAT